MLLWFVILYLMVSVGIGLLAATRVHNAKDFAVAGRSLPLPVVTATVFATWFGAEAVFGVSATFVKEGLTGVVADPFGSSMCLIIAGILFSRYLYKLNILTLGDFYRMRYNRTVEVLTTICIVASYLGWVAAQIKALGLIFFVVTDGAVSQQAGMILGAAIVVTYTTFGGMFSVAILDFVQMAVSMGGLLFIAWVVSGKVDGGGAAVISHASLAGKLDFFFDTACVEGNLVLRHDGRVELTDITESHPLQEFADYVRAAVAMAMCYPMRDADGVPVTVTMRYRCIITHDGSPQVLTDDTSIVATQRSLDE